MLNSKKNVIDLCIVEWKDGYGDNGYTIEGAYIDLEKAKNKCDEINKTIYKKARLIHTFLHKK